MAYAYDPRRPIGSTLLGHVQRKIEAGPASVRCFTTDVSSASAPGDVRALTSLFNSLRQTSNALCWQDHDAVRRDVSGSTSFQFDIDDVNEAAGRENLFELRKMTGLTWEELAQIMNVDRRTLHNWAQGGPVRIDNRKRLADLLRLLRYMDRGSAEENRLALHAPTWHGQSVIQLAAQSRFHEAKLAAGKGPGRAKLSASAGERTQALGLGYFERDGIGVDEKDETSLAPIKVGRSKRIPLKRD